MKKSSFDSQLKYFKCSHRPNGIIMSEMFTKADKNRIRHKIVGYYDEI